MIPARLTPNPTEIEEKNVKVCILSASPRPKGNTASLLAPFEKELAGAGAACAEINLFKKDIKPCLACRACQDVLDGFGCPLGDDMEEVFEAVLAADCLVLSSPIYAWSCTPPLKAALDRLVYTLNKYYGRERGGALGKGKHCAFFTTCGYDINYAVDPFVESLRRYSKHCRMHFAGVFAARDFGYKAQFVTESKLAGAREFARQLAARLKEPEGPAAAPLEVFVSE